MSYGFVYVLGNRAMPGVYKVGYTERSPSLRCEELSRSTSVPCEFDLICYAEYTQAHAREQEIHRLLAGVRVSPDREFFKCDLVRITDLVMDEELAISVSTHQMEPFLYADSPIFRERLCVADELARDIGIVTADVPRT
ncbi:hypothetical protein WM08_15020 [Burkholderia ubonensis]|uniref:GIY-YIG nuclease family protein n=1 Tax=Burkholderia ubonensis TaxID=101571 RepID=UPI00075FCF07|nr:GIY-YIG nuclease family protein [Burkholderia ubonensis]KWI90168.1 hypothetical protein WM08_15020 [Burkholderia ubonensis]